MKEHYPITPTTDPLRIKQRILASLRTVPENTDEYTYLCIPMWKREEAKKIGKEPLYLQRI